MSAARRLGVAAAVAYIPLSACDDFQRLVAFLEELDWMGDGLRFADQFARLLGGFRSISA